MTERTKDNIRLALDILGGVALLAFYAYFAWLALEVL